MALDLGALIKDSLELPPILRNSYTRVPNAFGLHHYFWSRLKVFGRYSSWLFSVIADSPVSLKMGLGTEEWRSWVIQHQGLSWGFGHLKVGGSPPSLSLWLLTGLRPLLTINWLVGSIPHHMGLSSRLITQGSMLPRENVVREKVKTSTREHPKRKSYYLITLFQKWRTITSALFCWSHRPILGQCERGQHRM